MSIAEKLTTVAENVPKVYEAGQKSMVDESKIIEKTVTGTNVVVIDDVSEIPHDVGVRLASDTVTDFSGVSVTRCGKNLIPYPYPLFKDTVTKNGITATLQDDGGILLNGTATGYVYINLAILNLGTVGVGNWINDNGLISNSTGVAGVTVRYDPNGYVIFIMVVSGTACNNLVVYPQIEKGTKSTDFELGVNHKTYTANADGKVDGIKSLCPVMTLISNVDGVELIVDYHKSWGKQAEWHRFWDAFQLNGNRTAYDYAFYSCGDSAADGGWTDEIFKPKYDIKPKGTCYSMFFRTNIKDLTKSGCGVDIDFSQATTFNQIFYASGIVTLGVLDLRNVTNISQAFQYCNYLKTIEKIILKDDGSQSISDNTFQWASELQEIRFEGTIGCNINFQWQGKLSNASITSIINALSATASGKTATFKRTAVSAVFGTPEYSTEWQNLVATKQNWTISLV